MVFHGKFEQMSAHLTQGTGDRPKKDSITVSFGQPVSIFGVIYRSMGEGLLTWAQVRVSLQECWLRITDWIMGEGLLTGTWVKGYPQEQG